MTGYYTCRRCSGMGDEEITFEVFEGGKPYTHRVFCPICGTDRSVEEI